MIHQYTLKNSIQTTGVGIHSGQNVHLTLRPAPVDSGIVFRRIDVEKNNVIPAHIEFISNTDFCTCLEKSAIKITTTEHLLSALSGLQIDNAVIELNLAELPIMDGSALPFVKLIDSAGLEKQVALKKYIKIKKYIEIKEGDKVVSFNACDEDSLKITMEIDFNHPVIKKSHQKLSINLSPDIYRNQIACARTFGFLTDYDYMREKKLACGASLDNTIVLDDVKILNQDGLRDPDEFVKHKILDAIGDLSLLGHPILGEFSGYKSGHALNSRLMKKLLEDKTAFDIVNL